MQLNVTSKYKKMIAGALVAAGFVSVMAFGGHIDIRNLGTSLSDAHKTDNAQIQTEDVTYKAYDVFIGDKQLGTVTDDALVATYLLKAKEEVEQAIGYKPEYDYTLEIRPREVSEPIEPADLSEAFREAMYVSVGEIKVKGYAMKIDDFCVILSSKEELIEVLESAQSLYVQDDNAITVDLVSDDHNPMVMTPEINILSKELPKERIFVTSDMTAAPGEENLEGAPMENLEAEDDQFLEAVVKEVRLDQQIVIVETYVNEEALSDAKTATEMITKEHEKEKKYTVEKGDSPSVIAVENSMTTSELYALNPGLKENARRMQIGDKVVVKVPEPELFVTTVEDVIYTEIIDRDIIYVNNPEDYIGTNTVIKAGSDGVIEVRATVEKLNGKIINQQVLETTVVLDPVTETQSRGVKALPVTTATGTFEMPMLSYRFTSGFGTRWGRLHKGIDLAAPIGTAIKASDGGRIIKAGWDGGYGYCIEIDHGKGLTSKYAHCSALYVSVGEEVSQYQTIAAVGNTGNSTGPHLHFEIRKWNKPVNPMNYLK